MVMELKNLVTVRFVFLFLMGCEKENNENGTLTFAAKWNLVTDYTANHTGQINTYTGVPGNYFDFRPDGKCYTKEGSLYDTLSYAITSDTTMNIKPFGFSNAAFYSGKANPLTLHAATITNTGPYPPGNVDFRQVKLSR
jgi:hypothetical protein